MKNVRKIIALAVSVIMALSVFAVVASAKSTAKIYLDPVADDATPGESNFGCYYVQLYYITDDDDLFYVENNDVAYDQLVSWLEDYEVCGGNPTSYSLDRYKFVFSSSLNWEEEKGYGRNFAIATYTPASATEPTQYDILICNGGGDEDGIELDNRNTPTEGWTSTANVCAFSPCDDDENPEMSASGYIAYLLALDEKDDIYDMLYDASSFEEFCNEISDYIEETYLDSDFEYDEEEEEFSFKFNVENPIDLEFYAFLITYTPAGEEAPTNYFVMTVGGCESEWMPTVTPHYIGAFSDEEDIEFIKNLMYMFLGSCEVYADFIENPYDKTTADNLYLTAVRQEFDDAESEWKNDGVIAAYTQISSCYNYDKSQTETLEVIAKELQHAQNIVTYYEALIPIGADDFVYTKASTEKDDGYTCGFAVCYDCLKLLAIGEDGEIIKEYDTSEYFEDYIEQVGYSEYRKVMSACAYGTISNAYYSASESYYNFLNTEWLPYMVESNQYSQEAADFEVNNNNAQLEEIKNCRTDYIELIENLLDYFADELEEDGFVAPATGAQDEPVVTDSSFTCPLCSFTTGSALADSLFVMLHSVIHILYAFISAFKIG